MIFAIVALLLVVEIFDARRRVQHERSDWIAYWSASRHFTGSADPYSIPAKNGEYYIYPPLFALLLRPLTRMRAENAEIVWSLLNVLMTFGCYFEWRRIYVAMRAAPPPRWLVLTTVFAASLPMISTLQGGQANIATLYLTLLGFRLAFLSDRVPDWIAGGLVLALPAAIKLSPGLVGAVAIIQLLASRPDGAVEHARKRGVVLALSFAAGAAMWFLVVPTLLVGWRYNLDLLLSFYDHVIFTRAGIHAFNEANQGFVRVVAQYAYVAGSRLGSPIPPGAIAAATTAVALGFGIPVALAIRKLIHSGTLFDHVLILGLAAAASLFYSPMSWHMHFTLAMPFVASAPLRLIDTGRERAAQWLAAGVGAALAVQSLLYGIKVNIVPLLGPVFAVCVVAFAVTVIRATGESRALMLSGNRDAAEAPAR